MPATPLQPVASSRPSVRPRGPGARSRTTTTTSSTAAPMRASLPVLPVNPPQKKEDTEEKAQDPKDIIAYRPGIRIPVNQNTETPQRNTPWVPATRPTITEHGLYWGPPKPTLVQQQQEAMAFALADIRSTPPDSTFVSTGVKELTTDEWNALNPAQKSAVTLNTQLHNAWEASGRNGSSELIDQMLAAGGLDEDKDMNYLTSPTELAALAGEWDTDDGALSSTSRAKLNQVLQAGGQMLKGFYASGSTSRAPSTIRYGFGSNTEDELVQWAFDAFADALDPGTPEAIMDEINRVNTENGLDVTWDDVVNFAALRLEASDLAEANKDASFSLMTRSDAITKPVAQIRQELGL